MSVTNLQGSGFCASKTVVTDAFTNVRKSWLLKENMLGGRSVTAFPSETNPLGRKKAESSAGSACKPCLRHSPKAKCKRYICGFF